MSKKRYSLELEFDGSDFCGWQLQSQGHEASGKPSLQATLENALATFFGRPAERFPVQGCGRTDAGVHARQFFAHFDWVEKFHRRPIDENKLREALNALLPEKISVLEVQERPEDWHALKDVLEKSYVYTVFIGRRNIPFLRHFVHQLRVDWENPRCRLDLEALEEGMKIFEGEHDFTAFASAGTEPRTGVRKINRAKVEFKSLGEKHGHLLRLEFKGPGFLKQMVRNMVGFLLELAQGKRPKEELSELLRGEAGGKTRSDAGLCAPAKGLCLESVKYKTSVISED